MCRLRRLSMLCIFKTTGTVKVRYLNRELQSIKKHLNLISFFPTVVA